MSTGMTSHERIIAALQGREVDRAPWCPFLAYWWEHQSKSLQQAGQAAFMKTIGADALLRGFSTPFVASNIYGIDKGYGFTNEIAGDCRIDIRDARSGRNVVFTTPYGKMSMESKYSSGGDTLFLTEHPVKTEDDYKKLSCLVENMVLRPDYEAVSAAVTDLGEDGVYSCLISPFYKSPFQALVENFVGTEELIYHLADFPETVEETLAVMSEKADQAVAIALASPAEAFISWEDSSTTNISPDMYRRYIAPCMEKWSAMARQAGKLFIHHACGHIRDLLAIMVEAKPAAIESVSPPPTGNISMRQAKVLCADKTTLIGGIEPVHFLTLSDCDFDNYLLELLAVCGKERYILANSDSCPPGVKLERFFRVTEIVNSLDNK